MKKLRMKLSSSTTPDWKPLDVDESLSPADFCLRKTVRHGLPNNPTALAIDPVQKIVAIGSKAGAIRIYPKRRKIEFSSTTNRYAAFFLTFIVFTIGRPTVETYVEHEPEAEVQQLLFLVNEGALISMTNNNVLHLWTLRQKCPAVVQTLNFSRESITCCHLPVKSEWLYIGTDAGNVYLANVHTFVMSAYSVHWNHTIDIAQKGKRPGPVVFLAEQPGNHHKLMIGFKSGLLVFWNLELKKAEMRFQYQSKFYCMSWLSDGTRFACGHSSGELSFWSLKSHRPEQTVAPHDKTNQSLLPVAKVEYLSCSRRDPVVVFSGGVPREDYQGTVTIYSHKSLHTLTFDGVLVDFGVLCEQPFPDETRDPHTLIVLLENQILFYSMTLPGFPHCESPYGLNLSVAPVTSTAYYTDLWGDFVNELTSVSAKTHKKASQKSPLVGGMLGCSGPSATIDLIITGHVDGSVRLWNASSVNFQPIYTFDLSVSFIKRPPVVALDCLAIQQIYLCTESRMLCLTTTFSNLVCCPFSRLDLTVERREINVVIPNDDSVETTKPVTQPSCQFKTGSSLLPAGFQPTLCCQLQSESPDAVLPQISSIAYSSSLGLLAIGMTYGVCLVDLVQARCVWTLPTSDIYGLSDPSYVSSPSHVDGSGKKDNINDLLSPRGRSRTAPSQASRKKSFRSFFKAKLAVRHGSHENMAALTEGKVVGQNSTDSKNGEELQDTVESIRFATTYGQKEVGSIDDCVWIGTSAGNVACVVLQVPRGADRQKSPVMHLPTGSLFQLKDPVLLVTLLDHKGCILQPSQKLLFYAKEATEDIRKTSFQQPCHHFAVFCSERQVKVYTLPARAHSLAKAIVPKDCIFIKAAVIPIKDQCCACCLTHTGQILVYSLPSLKTLLSVDSKLPVDRIGIGRTFCIAKNGYGMYMGSKSEIQRVSLLQTDCLNIPDSFGELFTFMAFPERPSKGFFARLFSSPTNEADREELFGKQAGRSSVAERKFPDTDISLASSPFSKAREALVERGRKVSELADKTERMAMTANSFASAASDLRKKYESKKWYELW
eukprot:m.62892 g.62892  ORF g.62892 m.62892 type:complete len:1056 (+) comp35122_c0_seq5:281-3448(+)